MLGHKGATDLDVAMFHRDGGKHMITSTPLKPTMMVFLLGFTHLFCFCFFSRPFFSFLFVLFALGEDSDSDSDLSLEEERSLSIPSSESEDNVRLRGRIQRRFKRTNHSERLLTDPTHNGTKGIVNMSSGRCCLHAHHQKLFIIPYK